MNSIIDDLKIKYPTDNHRKYISEIYNYCLKKRLSLVLKGSLAKGTAKRFSDIDIMIIGKVTDSELDEIINIHGRPIMTNFTERPKGIMILVYSDSISVDLDIRNTIILEEIDESYILLKNQENFKISTEINRRVIKSQYIPNRLQWYKVLRLVHRSLIKYLCGNKKDANELLIEVKENLGLLKIDNVEFCNEFEYNIKEVFTEFQSKYTISGDIIALFESMFLEFENGKLK
ncbi:nucleotidyltransferase domain-containing protein [Herbivorax sp. ANBcel31]|uniref:nucleotidyltransferase domain-containing protein n=1 Tax=Herbivorax sp. ANBcel31 TaxID=3069754 RepID=UPI0027B2A23E|nr:nucleotidyltransferase domain-containing protein [Herbivorax sp. ANBcel31]MDQ2088123.1 nucleotidyltransferase domain-containing protein [Herbivorax sp. ANBcel31]